MEESPGYSCVERGVTRAKGHKRYGLGRGAKLPMSSSVGRIAAIAALVGAVVVVLLLVLGGGSTYSVTAQFESASQLVKGNNVSVAGVPVGSVSDITLSDDGQALV